MKKYNCLFIDLDGPIIDGKYRHYYCYKDIINYYGGVPIDIELYWNMKRDRVNIKTILKESQFNEPHEKFMEIWLDNIERNDYLKYDYLKPDIVNTINRFKESAESIYLITMRNNHNNLMMQLQHLSINNVFNKVLVCNSDDYQPKYKLIKTELYGIGVIIGDTEIDMEAANLLNTRFIGIRNGLRNYKVFEGIESYEELYMVIL